MSPADSRGSSFDTDIEMYFPLYGGHGPVGAGGRGRRGRLSLWARSLLCIFRPAADTNREGKESRGRLVLRAAEGYYRPCLFAASITCPIRTQEVTLPTPPGTGVIA